MKTIQLLAAVAMLGSVLHVNADVPTTITYQGRVQVSGANFTGTGQFKFALVDGGSNAVTHWSNDGSSAAGSEPAAAVSLPVAQGLFTASLGDATVANMIAIPPVVLTNRDVRLRIWFNDGANGFAALSPDQPLTSAPYALHALNAGTAGVVTGPVPASLLAGTIAPANLADGGIDASKLASGSVTSDKIADGSIVADDLNLDLLGMTFWRLGGNAGTTPGVHFLGTTDNRPLDLRVNNQSVLRLVPSFQSPNLIGGHPGNFMAPGVSGSIIAGGGNGNPNGTNRIGLGVGGSVIGGGSGHSMSAGSSAIGGGAQNEIQSGAFYSAIGGGFSHVIETNAHSSFIGGGQNHSIGTNTHGATIAGGLVNKIGADARGAAIGGGTGNNILADAISAVIGGGVGNTVSATGSTVSGGTGNSVAAAYAAMTGGQQNRITPAGSYAAIGGGSNNVVTGADSAFATIPGGVDNRVAAPFSLAAGRRAKANHAGTSVWADSQDADFASTASNQFNVRASGGVRFETSGAGATVDGQPVIAGQVNTFQIADDAVTASKLAVGSVTSNAITTGAVNGAQLADGAVTLGKLRTVPTTLLEASLANPSPANGDEFGTSVAAAGGDKVIVGAPLDDRIRTNAGIAYLFRIDGTLLTTFTNPAPEVDDFFGHAVAAAGQDKVLIGAHGQVDPWGNHAGLAYLFDYNGTLLQIFASPNPTPDGRFGYAVAGLGTDKVVVGAAGERVGGNSFAGRAYLFSTNGILLATFEDPVPEEQDFFGAAIAPVGSDQVIIGAYGDGNGPGAFTGAALLFSANGTWLRTFGPPPPVVGNEFFGYSVAGLGFDRILIGALQAEAFLGAVYLYSTSGALLTTFTNPVPSPLSGFGSSVAALGTSKVLIGSGLTIATPGMAHVLDTNATLLATIRNPSPTSEDQFGYSSSALTADSFVIGARKADRGALDSGATYVFSLGQMVAGLAAERAAPESVDSASLAPDAVTSSKIADGAVSAAHLADGGITGADLANGIITTNKLSAATLNSTFWKLNGNAGTTAGTHFLGTTDNQPLELKVNNVRALRVEPTSGTPNLIGGYSENSAAAGVVAGVIGGGGNSASPNSIQANYTAIAGGIGNGIETGSLYASIGGGRENLVRLDSQSATISGGRQNTIHTNSDYGVIGGGFQNHIESDVPYATLAGGNTNQILSGAAYATISGGWGNMVRSNADASVIAGGVGNTVSNDALYATIGGGYSNRIFASAVYATIAGGTANTNGGPYSAISGGWQNDIRSNAQSSIVEGGYHNVISNNSSYCVIAGGAENRIDGGAWYATIAGGYSNRASGYISFAAGQRAKAIHEGAFVWADTQTSDFASTAAQQVSFRCNGGVRFTSGSGALNQTVSWVPGNASWTFSSDRNLKEAVKSVDARMVLERVASLPVNEWNFKGHTQRHIGPMAQDFHAAFPLNDNDTQIDSGDLHGVALAAIQGLNKKLEQELQARDAEIGELKRTVSEMKQLIQGLAAPERKGQ